MKKWWIFIAVILVFSLVLVGGVEAKAYGENCNNDNQCDGFLVCDEFYEECRVGVTSSCYDTLSCLCDEDRLCESGAVCVNDHCVGELGGPCFDFTSCVLGLVCLKGTCQDMSFAGEGCGVDTDCAWSGSNYDPQIGCYGGICKVDEDTICIDSFHCGTEFNLICDGGECVELPAVADYGVTTKLCKGNNPCTTSISFFEDGEKFSLDSQITSTEVEDLSNFVFDYIIVDIDGKPLRYITGYSNSLGRAISNSIVKSELLDAKSIEVNVKRDDIELLLEIPFSVSDGGVVGDCPFIPPVSEQIVSCYMMNILIPMQNEKPDELKQLTDVCTAKYSGEEYFKCSGVELSTFHFYCWLSYVENPYLGNFAECVKPITTTCFDSDLTGSSPVLGNPSLDVVGTTVGYYESTWQTKTDSCEGSDVIEYTCGLEEEIESYKIGCPEGKECAGGLCKDKSDPGCPGCGGGDDDDECDNDNDCQLGEYCDNGNCKDIVGACPGGLECSSLNQEHCYVGVLGTEGTEGKLTVTSVPFYGGDDVSSLYCCKPSALENPVEGEPFCDDPMFDPLYGGIKHLLEGECVDPDGDGIGMREVFICSDLNADGSGECGQAESTPCKVGIDGLKTPLSFYSYMALILTLVTLAGFYFINRKV